MLSPVATQAAAARQAPESGERELKYAIPGSRVHIARQWLERTCRPDPQFPSALVWTVYYDTPALDSLGEKINSDYLKRKVRVRWYSDASGGVTGPAFVEAKLRVGNRRFKVRERLPFAAEDLAGRDLRDVTLQNLPMLLQRHGILHQESWIPLMLLRYRRDRFLEPISRSRISLDTDIAAVAVNRRVLSAMDPSPLWTAVLEVKGSGDRLPPALQPMLALGFRKRAFSKFLAVYAHMTRQAL
jgi:hypothetical protein